LRTCIVEATNGPNWGKFLVGLFGGEEWSRQSVLSDSGVSLLTQIGHDATVPLVFVLDLQTSEGAVFTPPTRLDHTDAQWAELARICAANDLSKHQVWVCVLFAPFLAWLYTRKSFDDLPARVALDAPFAMRGHRHMRLVSRQGATTAE
jgi:hypothetical protein